MLLAEGNRSSGATFILLGFSEDADLQVPLFLVFLTIYTITVLGNLGMIMVIRINPKLHTPMYFFLSHLSFVDFCYSTTVTPKLLENLVVEDRSISFIGCIMQFLACITFMLAVMAYDRSVAVCNPLLYTIVMSQKLCAPLVVGPYTWGIISSLTLTYFFLSLSFCGSNIIKNVVFEHSVIVSVSCSDPSISQVLCFVIAIFNEVSSLGAILTTYIFIFIAVIKMSSAVGCQKAFSTCASHLTAIIIFHGTVPFLYCVPKNAWLIVKVGSVLYTVIVPMLNPLIYSLRNKDVKESCTNSKSSQANVKVNSICYALLIPMLNSQTCSMRHKNEQFLPWKGIKVMVLRNLSVEPTFALLGFTDYPELQIPLFLMFLLMYVITIVGNLGMIVIININPKFHTPMYLFLSHLSFVDFCYSSIVTPKLLENLVMADKSIFYFSCMTQYFLSCTAVVTESFLLAVMAYDRFVAICNPLLYTVAMSQRLCALLVAGVRPPVVGPQPTEAGTQ
ncbi:Olfactory receptor 5D13 [Plecturocebus cupreus]